MNKPTLIELFEVIRQRANAATPGDLIYIKDKRIIKQDGQDNAKVCSIAKWNDKQEHADGEFFAHARTDVPALLDCLECALNEIKVYAPTQELDRIESEIKKILLGIQK